MFGILIFFANFFNYLFIKVYKWVKHHTYLGVRKIVTGSVKGDKTNSVKEDLIFNISNNL